MTLASDDLSWPACRLNEALEALARTRGLAARTAGLEAPPAQLTADQNQRLGPWIASAADWLGLEAEPVETPYAEVNELLTRAGPAIFRIPGNGTADTESRFLSLAGRPGPR